MSTKTTLIKNTTINSFGHLYLTLASFFSLPFTLKYLGSEQFALLILISTVVNLVSVFNCGLFQATIRYLNISLPSPKKLKRYLTSAFILTSLLASLWFVLGFDLLPYLKNRFHLSSQLIILVIFLALLNLFTNFFNSLPQARHHFAFYNLKTLFVGSANTWLTAYLAFLHHSLLPLLLVRLIAQFATLIFELIYHFHFFNSFFIFSFSQLKSPLHSLFNYSRKKCLGIVSTQGSFHLPRLAFILFLPLNQLPIFSIPQSLLTNLQAFISQLTLALFPISAQSSINHRHQSQLFKFVVVLESLIVFGFGLVILLVFLFGKVLLNLWLHQPQLVNQILPILKLLAFAYLLTSLSAIPATILDALGKPEIPSRFATFDFLLQLLFLFILVPALGLSGLPLAILMANLIQVPLFLSRFAREIKA